MGKAKTAVPTIQDGKVDIVLGGGGIKGYAHVGFLKAVEARSIPIGDIIGVSIGSVVATFYANGYSPDRIDQILSAVLQRLDPDMLARALRSLGKPRRLLKGGADLSSLFRELCTTYKLEPKDNLKIVAFNVRKRKPVVFQGSNYDLPSALTASCSVPGVMRPVWYEHDDSVSKEHGKHHLVDGGVYHPHPTEFCGRRAVVSRLGHARRLPKEKVAAADMIYHLLEMAATVITDRFFGKVGEGHLVIRTGLPCVASLNFHPSEKTCRKMVEYGYKKACEGLDSAIESGFIPGTKPPDPAADSAPQAVPPAERGQTAS
jgi:patatin-like phospholipase/acyl hydrolase